METYSIEELSIKELLELKSIFEKEMGKRNGCTSWAESTEMIEQKLKSINKEITKMVVGSSLSELGDYRRAIENEISEGEKGTIQKT